MSKIMEAPEEEVPGTRRGAKCAQLGHWRRNLCR